MRILKLNGKKILEKELRRDFNFFIKEANINKNSKGYGLIRDKDKFAPDVASIASVGYGFAALVIGAEAITDVIFGDVNPCAKLTMSFPQVSG